MEAFALQKIKKKKLEEEKKKEQQLSELVQTRGQILERNRLLGFPDPPLSVYAVGKSECAAVWWVMAADKKDEITGWEIHRYRKNPGKVVNGEWCYKGYVRLGELPKHQNIVNQLTDGYQYRFTVKAVNAHGASAESPVSNPVMVEQPLPPGWFRFHDPTSDHFFYANVKTKQSSWERPEKDPYFLEEQIVLNFTTREIEHLRSLFDEDISNFRVITHDQLLDILQECGEKLPVRTVRNLLREFGDSEELSPKLSTWPQFMALINHLKTRKMTQTIPLPKVGLQTMIRRNFAAVMFRGKRESVAHWVIRHSKLAERDYYFNTVTHEKRWYMPDEVRFYISPKLLSKLFTVFNYGHLESFRRYFSMLDVDGSGDLSAREVMLLFEKLEIEVTDKLFSKLLVIVDLNSNGTVEFDEFCWMMYMLAKKSKVWRDIRKLNARRERQRRLQKIGLPASSKADLNDTVTDEHFEFNHIGEKIMKITAGQVVGGRSSFLPITAQRSTRRPTSAEARSGVSSPQTGSRPSSPGTRAHSPPRPNEDLAEGIQTSPSDRLGVGSWSPKKQTSNKEFDDIALEDGQEAKEIDDEDGDGERPLGLETQGSWASIDSQDASSVEREMMEEEEKKKKNLIIHCRNGCYFLGKIGFRAGELAAIGLGYVGEAAYERMATWSDEFGYFLYNVFFETAKRVVPVVEVGPHGPYCFCGCRST